MKFNSVIALFVVVFIASTAPEATASLVTSHISSDSELAALLPDPACVAEGRYGNGETGGTYELAIGQDADDQSMTGQHEWSEGEVYPFTFSYHTGTGLAALTLGEGAVTYAPIGSFTDIFVRVRAAVKGGLVLVTSLELDGETVNDSSTTEGQRSGTDILRIQGGALSDGFTLNGTVQLDWGRTPGESKLVFQVYTGRPDMVTRTESQSWGAVKKMFR